MAKSNSADPNVGPAASHPFGAGAHPIFVPAGFCFPDGSNGAITEAQPPGAAAVDCSTDSVGTRIVTIESR